MNPLSACELSAKTSSCALIDARHLDHSRSRRGVNVNYGYDRTLACCGRVAANLNNRDSFRGNNMLYKFFWSNGGVGADDGRAKNPSAEQLGTWNCAESHSAGVTAAADVDEGVDVGLREEEVEDDLVASDQRSPGNSHLKLICGSCCLPHPNKVETGGEDALFICVDEQAIGVADGVGGWALHGIDAGEYARELMANAISAIKEEPKGFIDPARVLEKAHARTKKVGSSTACIIALTDQGIHAVNLGDSGFIVVREGSTIFQSPSQQHGFNYPFQLDAGGQGDLPKDAQVFKIPVAAGDVIVAGSDGLFDNLYTDEVAEIVKQAIHTKLGPQAMAKKLAALARERGLDKSWKSPFAAAAQEAGFFYVGGKLDDVSVVVSYVATDSGDS